MKYQPLISVVVPVYNAEQYLEQCLESILGQTYTNLEIVCVNDGSTDNSLEILDDFKAKDDRVIVIDKENGGASSARNNGINKSNGEYLMFVDSDDWLSLNACETALEALENNNADVAIYSCELVNNETHLPKFAFGDSVKEFNQNECFSVLYRRCFGLLPSELNQIEKQDYLSSVCMKIYKKEIITKNNISFININEIGSYEDGFFNLKYFGYIKSATYSPKILYHYRRDNKNSNTTKFKKELPQQWERLFGYMQEEIKVNDLPSEFSVALNNRKALSIIGLGLNVISCKKSAAKKVSMIRHIINTTEYRSAVKALQTKNMHLHWKTFFICVKLKMSFMTYFLLVVMNRLRDSNRK